MAPARRRPGAVDGHPAINATVNEFSIDVNWNGARSGLFPDHTIVEKTIR
ncbi:hypothetical protein ACIPLC_33370 [Kitasatospora sp. NPDC086801]